MYFVWLLMFLVLSCFSYSLFISVSVVGGCLFSFVFFSDCNLSWVLYLIFFYIEKNRSQSRPNLMPERNFKHLMFSVK